MASADDRDAGFVQQLSIAANVEKQRRIVDFLQAGWVTRVIDGGIFGETAIFRHKKGLRGGV